MDIIKELMTGLVRPKEIAEKKYSLNVPATFPNGKPITVNLEEEDGKWVLSDNKCTLTYMNEMYDLKSVDVKSCIQEVIKVYGFKISGGEVKAVITNNSVITDKFYDLIMCIGQLANMYAFFENPD